MRLRPLRSRSEARRVPHHDTPQGEQVSEIEFGIDRELLRDLLSNQCEPDVLIDMIRAAGISHETCAITLVITDSES